MTLATQDADHVVKGLFDIDAILGRGFDKLTTKLSGQGMAFLRGDFALRHSVALVSDQHYGDGKLGVGRRYGRARV